MALKVEMIAPYRTPMTVSDKGIATCMALVPRSFGEEQYYCARLAGAVQVKIGSVAFVVALCGEHAYDLGV